MSVVCTTIILAVLITILIDINQYSLFCACCSELSQGKTTFDIGVTVALAAAQCGGGAAAYVVTWEAEKNILGKAPFFFLF